MICQNNKTNIKYNYIHLNNDKVKLWNPTKKPFYINYDEWKDNYFVVDKWLKLT